MKKVFVIGALLSVFAGNAFAFNPDPTKFEYIGQKDDGCGLFYEIATAKADGQKGVIVMLQADPKNRTLRYYTDVVIDPEAKTIKTKYCRLYDYRDEPLEEFSLPNEAVSYKTGSLEDKIYQDLLAKGIVKKPEPKPLPPQPVINHEPEPQPVYHEPVRNNWQQGFAGGEEAIVDLPMDNDDLTIADF